MFLLQSRYWEDQTFRQAFGRTLTFAAIILGTLSLCCSAYADIVFCVDPPVAYWGVLLALITGASGGFLTILSGYCLQSHVGFRVWQPFQGGVAFCFLQYVGWMFYGVAVTMHAVFLALFQNLECRSGTIGAVGCLSLAAVLTLLSSISRFEPNSTLWPSHIKFIQTDNLVVVACLAASLIFSCLLDLNFVVLAPYRTGLVTSLQFVNIVAVTLVVLFGRRRFPKKRIFHPFQGGFYFVLMQSSGWAGIAVSIFFFLRFVIPSMATSGDAPARLLPGLLTALTFLWASSTLMLLLSLDTFKESSSVVHILGKFRLSREIIALLLIGVVSFFTNVFCDLAMESSQTLLQSFALLCQALVAPVIHVYASLTIRSYRIWQPFAGGAQFILLHGIAWTLFAVSHMVILLAWWNTVYAVVAAASVFPLLCDFILCGSLNVFEPTAVDAPTAAQQERDAASMYLNGELVTSLLLAVGGMTTLVVTDLSTKILPFHKAHVNIFGMLVLLTAPVLAQISGRHVHSSYRVLRPFTGGPDHVAVQTVAWTIWGASIVAFAVLEVNLLLDETIRYRWTSSSLALLSGSAYGLVVASIPLFHSSQQSGQEGRPNATSETTTTTNLLEGWDDWFEERTTAALRWSVMDDAREEALQLLSEDEETIARRPRRIRSEFLRCVLAEVVQRTAEQEQRITTARINTTTSQHRRRERETRRSQRAAVEDSGLGFLAVTLSTGSLVLGGLAEILSLSLVEPSRTSAVVPLSTASSLAALSACLLTHCVCGARRYGEAYRWWMPFGGGSTFSLLQTIGWALLSFNASLLFSSYYALVAVQDSVLFVGSLTSLGFTGFASHMFLVVSLSQFDRYAERDSERSFLHRHSEWFVGSILTIIALGTVAALEAQLTSGGRAVHVVPLLFAGIFACAGALLLGWASAFKSYRDKDTLSPYVLRPLPEPYPQGDRTSRLVMPPSNAAARGANIGAATLPERPYSVSLLTEMVVAIVLLLWVIRRLLLLENSYQWLVYSLLLVVVHHAVMLLTIVWNEHRSLKVFGLELWAEMTTFTVYSIHFICVGTFVYIGFFIRFSVGSAAFFLGMNLLSFSYDPFRRTVQVVCVLLMVVDLCQLSLDHTYFVLPLFAYTCSYSTEALRTRSRWIRRLSDAAWLWDACARYFTVRILSDLNYDAHLIARTRGQHGKLMMGYHPHGVCPYASIWGTLCSAWGAQGLPRPVVHVSSFLMAVPLIRDVLMAVGASDCTVDALRASLATPEVDAVLIVPGGQRECRQPQSSKVSFQLHTKNKGFFRLAIVEGAALVPIFCFGETDIMSGLPLPAFQFWARHKLGITYPQLPQGRLLLPLPRRLPLVIVVGEAIAVAQKTDPRPADIDAIHVQYYEALRALFDKYKAEAGYPDSVLLFSHE